MGVLDYELDLGEAEQDRIPVQQLILRKCANSLGTPVCPQRTESPKCMLDTDTLRACQGPRQGAADAPRGEQGTCRCVCKAHRADPQGTVIPHVPFSLPPWLASNNACRHLVQRRLQGPGHQFLLQVCQAAQAYSIASPRPFPHRCQPQAGLRGSSSGCTFQYNSTLEGAEW